MQAAEIMNRFSLSSEELEKFERDGYLGPYEAYEPEEMQAHLRELRPLLLESKTSIYSGAKGTSGVTNIVNYDRHLDIDFLAHHVRKREIVDRVVSILGQNVLCWRSEFFPKYPGDEGTDWHQASLFANVGEGQTKKPKLVWPEGSKYSGALTVWTAFTESTIENGCLQFVPGTHKTMFYDEMKAMSYDAGRINSLDKEGARRGFFGYDYRELQKDASWKPDESQAVPLVMKPGQFMIFWSTLLHASYPYTRKTGPMRLGYSARYVPTAVQIYPHAKELDEFGAKASLDKYKAVLVNGVDTYHHNKVVA